MMGPTRNLYNSRLSHPAGGNVFCGECGEIVGKIERMNYRYIKYFFVCKCGSVGKAELYRGKRPWLTYPQRQLYGAEHRYMCQNCESPLFFIDVGKVDNYAFAVICRCGVEYDEEFCGRRNLTEEKIRGLKKETNDESFDN